MLKKVLYLTIVFFIFLFVLKIFRDSSWSKIDLCLDKGGCWDYIRNRCEIDNQAYCVKNSSDCEKIWQGSWNFKEKYCNIQKKSTE